MCFEQFNAVWFFDFSIWNFWSMDFMDWDSYFVFNPKNLRLNFCVGSLWWYCVEFEFETRCWKSASRRCCSSSLIFSEGQVCYDTGYVLVFWALIWLFSPAWDAVKLTLKAGFICPFVINDPTNLGKTIVIAMLVHLQSIPYAENLPF